MFRNMVLSIIIAAYSFFQGSYCMERDDQQEMSQEEDEDEYMRLFCTDEKYYEYVIKKIHVLPNQSSLEGNKTDEEVDDLYTQLEQLEDSELFRDASIKLMAHCLRGGSLNRGSEKKNKFLVLACKKRNLRLIALLLSLGAHFDGIIAEILQESWDSPEMWRLLSLCGELFQQCTNSSTTDEDFRETLKILRTYWVIPSFLQKQTEQGAQTPLLYAVWNGNFEKVKILVEDGAHNIQEAWELSSCKEFEGSISHAAVTAYLENLERQEAAIPTHSPEKISEKQGAKSSSYCILW